MTNKKDDIWIFLPNNSEYPVKGRGNQTSNGRKVRNLEAVEHGWGKKCIGDALYAQTCLPYD